MSAPLLTDESIYDEWLKARAETINFKSHVCLFARAIDALARRPLLAEIERLTAERDAAMADAERLNYIEKRARCDPKMDGQHVWWPTVFNHRLIGPTLRAAIDAARSAT